MHGKLRPALIWAIVLLAGLGPLVIAVQSPLLAWRQGIYILAGFAGILGLGLLLLQPLLAAGLLPGLAAPRWRWVHRLGRIALTCCIALHVIGLWVTSPPDKVDALLFRAPTWFSVWGVLAMWLAFGAAGFGLMHRSLHIPPRIWRRAHGGLGIAVAALTVAHVVPIATEQCITAESVVTFS